MDVPAANIVRPIISSEMPMVSPTYKGKPKFIMDRNYSLHLACFFSARLVQDAILISLSELDEWFWEI